LRPLLHRWFVQYNPLYLISAALVLGGCFLLSRGLVSHATFWSAVGVTLVSEVYGLCLVGGAALLTRLGQRRPAVLLALLALLFQWDLTLHVETSAYWGRAGTYGAMLWLAAFVGKLVSLAWALRVRLDTRTWAAAVVAAVGLVAGPRLAPHLDSRLLGMCVAGWGFALVSLHGSSGGITSLVELSPWESTVMKQATHGAWLVSGVLLVGHVLVWAHDHSIAVSPMWPVIPLLCLRRVRRESHAWAILLVTLPIAAHSAPRAFFLTALLAAVALGLRALYPTFRAEERRVRAAAPEEPYRTRASDDAEREGTLASSTTATVHAEERARSFLGAIVGVYLAGWTLRWSGGPWPAHIVALDFGLAIVLLAMAWRQRSGLPLLPLSATYGHIVIMGHLLPTPETPIQWGVSLVSLGFLLLVGSLAASYALARSHLAKSIGGAHAPDHSEPT
jgi:hypothetical protein